MSENEFILLFYFILRGGKAFSGSKYGPGSDTLKLASYGCTGKESTIFNCSYWDSRVINSCGHDQDASVECMMPLISKLVIKVNRIFHGCEMLIVNRTQWAFGAKNDVVSTSMRRDCVASTLIRRHFTSCALWVEGQFSASRGLPHDTKQ